MTEIRITLFGPLTVRVAGQLVELRGSRLRAVLARLALAAGEVVSTDRIIDDIWAGEPPPKALGSLQVLVSHLRRGLEPQRPRRAPAQVLVSSPPGYALCLPEDAVDAWRFEALLREAAAAADPRLRAGRLRDALDCWTASVLPEFADAEWAAVEAARLQGLRATAVEQYAAAGLDLGWESTIIPDLERHLSEEPLREEAVRLLALALYRVGRQSEALAHLRAARDRLADELGLDPGPALRTLEADILGHSAELFAPSSAPPVAATPVVVAAAAPRAPHHATVIGRSPELGRLDTAAGTVIANGLRVAWVGAEAGAGKTTLAEVMADRLARRGWTVARGRCPEVDGAPPAWAWSEVVQTLGDAPPTLGSAFELAVAVGNRLRAATADGPLLVVLDDLHRADGATLQLLRGFAHDLADRPLLVLAAYRDTEVGPDLTATFAALAAATAVRLELGGLSRAGVAALIREHAPDGNHDHDTELLDRLIDRTGGNPLFVTEFARLLAAEGRHTALASVPAGVRDVLRRRISRLPGSARTVLQQAAVLGRELDVDLLLRIARRDEDEVLDGLEAAVLAGLLGEPGPGQVRFTHALVRDTLYEDTPALRRARWHAAALAELHAAPAPDVAALAHHSLAAATPATAADAAGLAAEAAEQAMTLNAPAEALQLAAAAVRMADLAHGGVPAETKIKMLIQVTRAAAQAGATSTARPARSRAVQLAADTGDEALLFAALTAYRAPISWTVRGLAADDTDIEKPLRRALAAPDTDPVTRVWLLIAVIFETENDAAAYGMAEVLAWSEEALALARTTGDAVALCAALNARAYLSLGPDLADEREGLVSELLSVSQQQGLLGYQALAHWFSFLCASARTDLAEAIRQADLAVEHSTSGQLAALVQVLEVYRAVLGVLAGRLEEAQQQYRRLAQQMADTGMSSAAEAAIVFELVLAFARGDMSGLADVLVALHEVHPDAMCEALVLCLFDAGREQEARQRWQERKPLRRNYYWLARMALFARAAVRVDDRDACADAYAELLPWSGRIAGIDSGSVAFGTVDEALALLADALGRPRDAARHRAGAEVVRARVAADLSPRWPSPSGDTSA
ncbi:BTAD domain-containing putative transcriptional regulator [Mycolicibacterium mengxianglii]|uniref:BTAD domain-containing putative transcriptional regulator n=1 Tax=Mycolicibacterium mengxianglii TaxID=2736649 RepID=UPI0018D14FD6|nr:BTAD domain-containing putative transcriptional regulator [Mycolicibacterium mengxianglii]